MKPDEHKKKKNTQYKKKHGITEKNKEVKGQGQNLHTGKGQQGHKSDIQRQHHTKAKEKEAKSNESSDSTSSDDEQRDSFSKASFQRRKVVSNWDRYDLPPDQEPVKTKGENFSKLLQVTGNSTSQFRFKEEDEEWTSSEQTELSLDLQDLSSSIGCIPLYKVLRLNKELFTAEQIAEYDRDSADKQIKYQSKYGTKSCNYISSSEKVDDIKVPLNTVESNALDELLDSVLSPSSCDVQDISHHSVTDQSQEGKVIDLEEDLNDLLTSGEHQVEKSLVKQETVEMSHKSEDNDLEDWLDSVLDS